MAIQKQLCLLIGAIGIIGIALLLSLLAGPVHGVQAAAVPTCFTSLNNTNTTFTYSVDSAAVRAAIAAAKAGDLVKVAGYCAGVVTQTGVAQLAYISKTLALQGGYTTSDWAVSYPAVYSTTLDAQGLGRVLFITNTAPVTVAGVIVTRGTISGPTLVCGVPNCGGGIFALAPRLHLDQVQVVSNTSRQAGGLYLAGELSAVQSRFVSNTAQSVGAVYVSGDAVLQNVHFERNHAVFLGGGLGVMGNLTATASSFVANTAGSLAGGGYVLGNAVIQNVQFERNTAQQSTGALQVLGNLAATASTFVSNTAGNDTGGVFVSHNAVLQDVHFGQNSAQANSYGAMVVGDRVVATNTTFIANHAQGDAGALYVSGFVTQTSRLVNVLMAHNQAGGKAADLYAQGQHTGSVIEILHSTFASPAPLGSQAIYVVSGTVVLTNTLIASHTVAISAAHGVVTGTHNLVVGNLTTTLGLVSLANPVTGTAIFANPAANDYHLRPGSAGINAGVNTDVSFDVDGDPRPLGGAPDVGYDELANVDVGLTKTAAPPGSVQPGQSITYTLTVTNSGGMVARGVVITDLLPSGSVITPTFVTGNLVVTPTGEEPYVWQVEDLAPNAVGRITVTGMVSPELTVDTMILTQATITARDDTTPQNNRGQASVHVQPAPTIRIYLPVVVR